MKTIRVLRNTGSNLPCFTEGQVVNVEDQTAELLCRLNLADLLKTIPTEPLRAVPENPTIVAAEEKLSEIKDKWLNGGVPQEAPLSRQRRHLKTKPELKE